MSVKTKCQQREKDALTRRVDRGKSLEDELELSIQTTLKQFTTMKMKEKLQGYELMS
jgi:hypothetical protein